MYIVFNQCNFNVHDNNLHENNVVCRSWNQRLNWQFPVLVSDFTRPGRALRPDTGPHSIYWNDSNVHGVKHPNHALPRRPINLLVGRVWFQIFAQTNFWFLVPFEINMLHHPRHAEHQQCDQQQLPTFHYTGMENHVWFRQSPPFADGKRLSGLFGFSC